MTLTRMIVLMTVCTVPVTAACGKKAAVAAPPVPAPAVEEAPPAPPPAPPPPAPETTPSAAALSEEELIARKTLDELNAERPLAGAFFDVDQAFFCGTSVQVPGTSERLPQPGTLYMVGVVTSSPGIPLCSTPQRL